MGKNVFIGQSGGPTAVINNSMRGVYEAVREHPGRFGTVYAGQNGILGALRENLLNVSVQDPDEVALLEVTPGAGVMGSCRYKLPKVEEDALVAQLRGVDIHSTDVSDLPLDVQDHVRVIQVFRVHDVGYFFYAGGNDSMDTAHKLNVAARALSVDLVCTGVPKTVDNDVGDVERRLVDHTPGYGSCASFWREAVQSAEEENRGSFTSDPILMMQMMGRRAGYLPASARLADPQREMPMVIILDEMLEGRITPEDDVTPSELQDVAREDEGIAERNLAFIESHIERTLARYGRAIVVLSEGMHLGDLGLSRDAFGHVVYATGMPVSARLAMRLNAPDGLLRRMKIAGNARYNVPGTEQRGYVSLVAAQDLVEAHAVGAHAVHVALDESGYMATIQRGADETGAYRPVYDQAPLSVVAAVDRMMPEEWVDKENADLTDGFVEYAAPLIHTERRVERECRSVTDFLSLRDSVRSETPLSVVAPMMNGRRRFARFRPIYAETRLSEYVPVALRAQ